MIDWYSPWLWVSIGTGIACLSFILYLIWFLESGRKKEGYSDGKD